MFKHSKKITYKSNIWTGFKDLSRKYRIKETYKVSLNSHLYSVAELIYVDTWPVILIKLKYKSY